MTPIASYLWLVPEINEPVTESGIILHNFIPRPDTGRVKHIGKYCDMDILKTADGHTIQVGDRVNFDPDQIRRANDGEEECIIIPDRNILSFIPEGVKVKVEDYELK